MTDFQKNTITGVILVICIFIVVRFFGSGIIDLFKSSTIGVLESQVHNLTSDLQIARETNKDLKEEYANVTSEATTDRKKLQEELERLEKYNDSLRTLVKNLKGELTSVHTGVGDISIASGGDVEKDTAGWFYSDSFMRIRFDPVRDTVSWKLSAIIQLEGVEKTDSYGNRRYIEQAYLKSKTSSDRFSIPWVASYISYKPKIKLFHWWNPRLHSDILFLGSKGIEYGASFNISSFGIGEYVEQTYFYFMSFGVASNFVDNISLTFSPVKYNIGKWLPVISNLNIAATAVWELPSSSFGVRLSLGLVH